MDVNEALLSLQSVPDVVMIVTDAYTERTEKGRIHHVDDNGVTFISVGDNAVTTVGRARFEWEVRVVDGMGTIVNARANQPMRKVSFRVSRTLL